MNPKRFLLSLAIVALLNSCTKDFPTPDKPDSYIADDEILNSAIEFFYPETPESNQSPSRIAPFVPFSTSQACKTGTLSILTPQIIVGQSVNIIYSNIDEYSGVKVNPKAIEWIVDGETILQLTTKLQLPYVIKEYNIEVIVSLEDGTKKSFDFKVDVTHNMPLDNDGYIEFDDEDSCVTGSTVGPSCLPQNGRVNRIIIIDPF